MKTIEITGTKREPTRKGDLKRMRREDIIPCVMYGGDEPTHFTVSKLAVNKALYTPETFIVKVSLDGKTTDAIIRESQFHPVTDQVMHVDFMRVNESNAVELELPVKLAGTPEGVRSGGKLIQMSRRLKVTGIPVKLPDVLEIDVTQLGLGKTIKVSDINLEGVKITSPAGAGIAAVEIPRAVKTGEVGGEEGEGEEGAAEEGAAEAAAE